VILDTQYLGTLVDGGEAARSEAKELDAEGVPTRIPTITRNLTTRPAPRAPSTPRCPLRLTPRPARGSGETVRGARRQSSGRRCRTTSTPTHASVQIVTGDAPTVLDGRPVRLGESREEIVSDLLDTLTDIVAPTVMLMDREFGTKDVRGCIEARAPISHTWNTCRRSGAD
jgi:hypothetical protein